MCVGFFPFILSRLILCPWLISFRNAYKNSKVIQITASLKKIKINQPELQYDAEEPGSSAGADTLSASLIVSEGAFNLLKEALLKKIGP